MKNRLIILLCFIMCVSGSGCKWENADIKRGFREYERGDFDDAIWNFNYALTKNSHSIEAYIGLAFSWEDKEDYDKAIEYYTKAIGIQNHIAPYFFRGMIWAEKGEYAKAIDDYTRSLEFYPEASQIYINRAIAYFGKKDYDKCWADVHKAESLGMNTDKFILIPELKKVSGRER